MFIMYTLLVVGLQCTLVVSFILQKSKQFFRIMLTFIRRVGSMTVRCTVTGPNSKHLLQIFSKFHYFVHSLFCQRLWNKNGQIGMYYRVDKYNCLCSQGSNKAVVWSWAHAIHAHLSLYLSCSFRSQQCIILYSSDQVINSLKSGVSMVHINTAQHNHCCEWRIPSPDLNSMLKLHFIMFENSY